MPKSTPDDERTRGRGGRFFGLLTPETARYVIVGVLTTAVSFAVFSLLRYVFDVASRPSQIISIAAAILFAYGANKIYVFKSRAASAGALAAEFIKFLGGRLAALVVEYFGFIFLLYMLGERLELLAKGAMQVVVLVMNYVISRFFVFKRQYKR
ncbi:MAG: GtrA family protein [Oscillospiraceae bacterium]|jgi:putative flippase GtrA|nr:GtrA family protein [Oscillospiraceae bacterium]